MRGLHALLLQNNPHWTGKDRANVLAACMLPAVTLACTVYLTAFAHAYLCFDVSWHKWSGKHTTT